MIRSGFVRTGAAAALLALAGCQPAPPAGEGAVFQGIVPAEVNPARGTIVIDGALASGDAPVAGSGEIFDIGDGGVALVVDIGAAPRVSFRADLQAAAPGRGRIERLSLTRRTGDGAAQVLEGAGRATITEVAEGAAESGDGARVRGRYEARVCDIANAGDCVSVGGAFAFDY